jgi:hypothetical protein
MCNDFDGDPIRAAYSSGLYQSFCIARAFPVFSTRSPKQ